MKKIIFLCLALMVLFACGYKEGVIHKYDKSYLKFVGNWQRAQVQIDDLKQFKLDDYFNRDTESGYKKETPEPKLYQLAPGKHEIKVFKDGGIVVKRILLLENQAIMEVFIP